MKILITGAFGQLGEILSEKLNKFNGVIKTGRKLPEGRTGMNLDICNKIILKDILQISKPDTFFIFNQTVPIQAASFSKKMSPVIPEPALFAKLGSV